jgi:hypothetical protein
MSLHDEFDLLHQAQTEAEGLAEEMVFTTDLDRRNFVFMSVAAAAATTFGFGAKTVGQARGGGAGRGADGGAVDAAGTQPPAVPVPLDNMEAVSWTFQPYPGGTGALLEKTYDEKGSAAFKRQPFALGAATSATAPAPSASRHGATRRSPPPTRRSPSSPPTGWAPPSRRARSRRRASRGSISIA